MSMRQLLRLLRNLREAPGGDRLEWTLSVLQAKDTDLSIRCGAVLAFNALMLGAVIQPIAASPGAPLSLDAAASPFETIVSLASVVAFTLAGFFAMRAITFGEEISDDGLEDDPEGLAQRLFAAYCTSVDRQRAFLNRSIRLTFVGLAVAGAVFVWVILQKMLAVG